MNAQHSGYEQGVSSSFLFFSRIIGVLLRLKCLGKGLLSLKEKRLVDESCYCIARNIKCILISFMDSAYKEVRSI